MIIRKGQSFLQKTPDFAHITDTQLLSYFKSESHINKVIVIDTWIIKTCGILHISINTIKYAQTKITDVITGKIQKTY